GSWMFMLLSIFILIVMGSVLEGAAALIIFGPLLVPVAATLGIAPLHYGVGLVISMGVGLFAPPLGLGLYGSCLIGGVPIEVTVKPMMKYFGLLFLCLLVIASVTELTLMLPRTVAYCPGYRPAGSRLPGIAGKHGQRLRKGQPKAAG